MKRKLPYRIPMISRMTIVVVILCLLLGKLSLVGYFVIKGGNLSFFPLLSQAVAQEEPVNAENGVQAERVYEEKGEKVFESLILLNEKKKELDSKEDTLKQQEEQLDRMKAEIEKNLETLIQKEMEIDKKITHMITVRESLEKEELAKLAKVFEATPPEQAGPMFSKLEVGLAARILFRMKGRQAGKIWGYVDPDQAVKISKELAKLK